MSIQDRIERLLVQDDNNFRIESIISKAREQGISPAQASDDQIKIIIFKALGADPEIDENDNAALVMPPSFEKYIELSQRPLTIARAAYKAIREQQDKPDTTISKKKFKALVKNVEDAILTTSYRLVFLSDNEETRKQLLEIRNYLLRFIRPRVIELSIAENEKEKKYKNSKEFGTLYNKILKETFDISKKRAKAVVNAKTLAQINNPYFGFLVSYAVNERVNLEDPLLANLFAQFPTLDVSFKNAFSKLNPLERMQFILALNSRENIRNYVLENGVPKFFIGTILSNYYHRVRTENGFGCNALQDSLTSALEGVKLNFAAFNNVYADRDLTVSSITNYLRSLFSCPNTESIQNAIRAAVEEMYQGKEGEEALAAAEESQMQLLEQKVYSTQPYAILRSELDESVLDRLVNNWNVSAVADADVILSEAVSEDKEVKKFDLSPMMFLGGDVTKSALEQLRETFSNVTDRLSILELRKAIIAKVGDLKDKSTYPEVAEWLQDRFNDGRISKKVFDFFMYFIEIYEDLSVIPSSGRNFGVLRLQKIADLPKRAQEDVAKKVKTYAESIEADQNIAMLFKNARLAVLSRIQLALSRRPVDTRTILALIPELELDESVQRQLERDLAAPVPRIHNLYRLLANMGKVKRLRDPLNYEGINRSRRERLSESKNPVQKALESLPPVSPSLKLCMNWIMLKPWLNLPQSFKYYIQHPKNLLKTNLSQQEKAFYGKRINIPSQESKHFYSPSLTFWKAYCKSYFTKVNGKTTCNVKGLITSFVDEKKSFIMGIYDSAKPEDNRPLGQKDFEAECKWIAQSALEPVNRSVNWYNTKLEGKALERAVKMAQERTLAVLNALPILKSRNNAQDANAIVAEINTKDTTVLNFFKTLERFLFYIDNESPVSKYAHYFKNLYLVSSRNAIGTLVEKTDMQMFPEQLLLTAEKRNEFNRLAGIYIDEKAQNDSVELYRKMYPYDKTLKTVPSDAVLFDSTVRVLEPLFGKSLVNICENAAELKGSEPEIIYNDAKGLKCLSHQDVVEIMSGSYTKSLPSKISDEIKLMYNYEEGDFEIVQARIQQETEDFVNKNFDKVFIEINEQDVLTGGEPLSVEAVVVEGYPALKALVNKIGDISTLVRPQDIDLALGHAASHARKVYKFKLELIVKDFVNSSYDLKRQMTNEAKERVSKYSDQVQARADKAARMTILTPLFALVEKNLPVVLSVSEKEDLVDAVTVMLVLPESKVERADEDVCAKCSAPDADLRTFGCVFDSSSGKYNTICQNVCGSCLDDTVSSYSIPSKKVLQEVELIELVHSFLRDYTTYDYLADLLRENDVDFNQYVNSKANMWSEVIRRKWLFAEESLQNKRHILERILDFYDIPVSDPLSDSYETLMANPDFVKIYDRVVEKYYGPGIVEDKKVVPVEMKQAFVDGIQVSRGQALDFVDGVANVYAHKPAKFDLVRNLVAPFYAKFRILAPPSAQDFKEVRKIDNLLIFLQTLHDTIKGDVRVDPTRVLQYFVDQYIRKLNPVALERAIKTAKDLNISLEQMILTRVSEQQVKPAIETLEKYSQVALRGETPKEKFREIMRILNAPVKVGEYSVNVLLKRQRVNWDAVVANVNLAKLIIYRLAYAFIERVSFLSELAQKAKAEEAEQSDRPKRKTGRKLPGQKKAEAPKADMNWNDFDAMMGDFEQLGVEDIFEDEKPSIEAVEAQVVQDDVRDIDFDVFSKNVTKIVTRPELILMQRNINNKLATFDIPEINIIKGDYAAQEMAGLMNAIAVEEPEAIVAQPQSVVESELQQIGDEQEYQAIDLAEFGEDIPNYDDLISGIENADDQDDEEGEREYGEEQEENDDLL
jgi:hypothetical protein